MFWEDLFFFFCGFSEHFNLIVLFFGVVLAVALFLVGFEFFVVISLVFFCFVTILFLVAHFLFHLYLSSIPS